jgi:hypothetical protein
LSLPYLCLAWLALSLSWLALFSHALFSLALFCLLFCLVLSCLVVSFVLSCPSPSFSPFYVSSSFACLYCACAFTYELWCVCVRVRPCKLEVCVLMPVCSHDDGAPRRTKLLCEGEVDEAVTTQDGRQRALRDSSVGS